MDYFEKPKIFPPKEVKNIPAVEKTEKSKNLDEHDSNKNESKPEEETPEEKERKRKDKNEAEGKGRLTDIKA